ncbi:MAG TPA: hypothetical protein VNI02_12295 [Blastocatellia bacterium]|jgi:hypothetical protein|nr:hypothetical protein [Blastocatellia bacterium]
MGTPLLPPDFKEFLKLLNANSVEYLLIGGYAVGYHGYVRATADMNIWVASNAENASRLISALREFGFNSPELSEELFLKPDNIARLGVPPFRIEMLTSISGVTFEECHAGKVFDMIDGVQVPIISLQHLKINKLASGRLKDLADLEHLP